MSPERFYSLGKLVEILQAPPGVIREAIDALNICAKVEINDRPHYDADQLDAISTMIRPVREGPAPTEKMAG